LLRVCSHSRYSLQRWPFEEGEAAYHRNDYAAALSYWQPLPDQGDAQFRVGALYALGLACRRTAQRERRCTIRPRTEVPERRRGAAGRRLSHMWMNLAAARAAEVTPGGIDRYVMVQCRDGVAARMTPDQIAEAQRMAREWKPKLVRSSWRRSDTRFRCRSGEDR
jgi:hypothetical protein